MSQIRAVTFDFYETLIRTRTGIGRGKLYQHYLAEQMLESEFWEHQVLYDVFEYYAEAYQTTLSEAHKEAFWQEFTRRLFARTDVRGKGASDTGAHGARIRNIFGPDHFELYSEVHDVLCTLHGNGLRLGVISNWQKGLSCFCEEMGILKYLDVVLSSAEFGVEKPDPAIFREASRRWKLDPETILHVGDQLEADVKGARSAGLRSVRLVRGSTVRDKQAIANLNEIFQVIERLEIGAAGG